MLLQPTVARGWRMLLGRQETKGRELDGGLWGQRRTARGDSSYFGLYLCGETGVLCPELGAGRRRLRPMPVLMCRYRAGPRRTQPFRARMTPWGETGAPHRVAVRRGLRVPA